jgi:UDP-N-acetylglucosamine--N-acetylmuramyl-(pentapeptide) pyrophosphoryl-undecaprenol N-acetylglucosamine transferase
MPQVAAKLGDTVTIWHQSGKGGQQTVQQAYAAAGQPQHKVTEFIDDMAAAYAWADVVVCRSGALTVSEIAAAGLPALFVRSSTKIVSSTGMRCRWRKPARRKFLNSLSSR